LVNKKKSLIGESTAQKDEQAHLENLGLRNKLFGSEKGGSTEREIGKEKKRIVAQAERKKILGETWYEL